MKKFTSSVSSAVQPGCCCSLPVFRASIYSSHFLQPAFRSSYLAFNRPCPGVTSPIPIEKPRLAIIKEKRYYFDSPISYRENKPRKCYCELSILPPIMGPSQALHNHSQLFYCLPASKQAYFLKAQHVTFEAKILLTLYFCIKVLFSKEMYLQRQTGASLARRDMASAASTWPQSLSKMQKMLFLDPDPSVPLSMLPLINSLF